MTGLKKRVSTLEVKNNIGYDIRTSSNRTIQAIIKDIDNGTIPATPFNLKEIQREVSGL